MPSTASRKRRIRRTIASVAVSLALVAWGGTTWALNRFVIDHVQIADVSAYQAAQSIGSTGSGTSAPECDLRDLRET